MDAPLVPSLSFLGSCAIVRLVKFPFKWLFINSQSFRVKMEVVFIL